MEVEKKREKLQPVVTGSVKIKKKTVLEKIKDTFISEDIGNVKDYIITDVIVPAVKKIVAETVSNTVDMLLYGEVRSTSRSSSGSRVGYVSYDRRSEDRRPVDRSSRNVDIYRYEGIEFDRRSDAEAVIDQLKEALDNYGIISVGDLYDIAGVSVGGNFTGQHYGWTCIDDACVVRSGNGSYSIRLPKAMPIN